MALENDLGRDPIRSLVLRIALPSMLAQFVSVLYSIVDRIYIGNIPEIGDIALAGVGVCGPVVTMVGSVASLICLGGSPLIGMSLGQGNEERAKRILSNCLLMLLTAAAVLTAVILPLRRPMLYLFGRQRRDLPLRRRLLYRLHLRHGLRPALHGPEPADSGPGLRQGQYAPGAAGRCPEHRAGPHFHVRPGHGGPRGGPGHGPQPDGQRRLRPPLPSGEAHPPAPELRRLPPIPHGTHPGHRLQPLPHHRRGQHHDHRHERRAPALRRAGAGGHAGHRLHHRPELHAGGHHALGGASPAAPSPSCPSTLGRGTGSGS